MENSKSALIKQMMQNFQKSKIPKSPSTVTKFKQLLSSNRELTDLTHLKAQFSRGKTFLQISIRK